MTLWSLLRSPAEQQIAGMPVPCAVALPDGHRIGAREARLSFEIRDMRALLHLRQGAIGRLAEDYVEGRLEIEGDMHDLMAAAPALLRGDPTHESHGWLVDRVSRTRRAVWERTHHSRAKDAAQIQHATDVFRLLRQVGNLGPFLDFAHRHDVDAVLVVTDGEADELDEIVARRRAVLAKTP